MVMKRRIHPFNNPAKGAVVGYKDKVVFLNPGETFQDPREGVIGWRRMGSLRRIKEKMRKQLHFLGGLRLNLAKSGDTKTLTIPFDCQLERMKFIVAKRIVSLRVVLIDFFIRVSSTGVGMKMPIGRLKIPPDSRPGETYYIDRSSVKIKPGHQIMIRVARKAAGEGGRGSGWPLLVVAVKEGSLRRVKDVDKHQ